MNIRLSWALCLPLVLAVPSVYQPLASCSQSHRTLAPVQDEAKAVLAGRGALTSRLGSEEHIVAMADFNGDGHLDLAITNSDPIISLHDDPQGAITIWLNDGSGGLRHGPVLTETEATVLASLDIDNDGDADLLAGSCCRENLTVWSNDGHGKFTASSIAADWYATDLATGDVNGDGYSDVVVPYTLGYQIGFNTGQGGFRWQFQEFRTSAHDTFDRVALADVDGDKDLDIVSITTMPHQIEKVSVLLNDGKGQFGQEHLVPVGSYSSSLAIGDLNGDARPDLVMVSTDNGETFLTFCLNDGSGHFGAAALSYVTSGDQPTDLTWVGLGDMEGDGDLDLILNTSGVNDV